MVVAHQLDPGTLTPVSSPLQAALQRLRRSRRSVRRRRAQVPTYTILKVNSAAITQITGATSRARPVVSFSAA